jgi:hypothetical protein
LGGFGRVASLEENQFIKIRHPDQEHCRSSMEK